MKITSVQAYELLYDLPKPLGVASGFATERTTLLVKITSDDGLFGWGETEPAFPSFRAMIEEQYRPLLLGKDPRDFRKLWNLLWGANFGNGFTVGAVSTALLDLRGKALKLSIADQFGGRLRDRVLAYASAMNYTHGIEPEKQYPEEARQLVKRGFRALKMRIGGRPLQHDLAAVKGVREAVGPEILLMADGNGGYTYASAVRMAQELERLHFFWFEEPLPQGNGHYQGYEKLAEKLSISLAGGEVIDSRATAKDLLVRRVFDIIQPDVSICGGVAEGLFIAEMARLHGVRFVPHCWGGAVTLAATLQLLALLPNPDLSMMPEQPLLELDVYENPFRDKIAKQPFELKSGYVDIPTGPGLGIEVLEEALPRYKKKKTG
jgi:D-galactarolactone cycloisomerase